MPELQEALLHGPGDASAVQVWRLAFGGAPERLRDATEALRRALEGARGGTYALVAIDPRLIGHELPGLLPREGPGGRFASTQAQVLVQISAPDLLARNEALRLAVAHLSPWASLDEEVLGGRLGDGQEPFGFRDGEPPSKERIVQAARIDAGWGIGGSWILYLRFAQALERFGRLPERKREAVLGVRASGEKLPHPAADAHVVVARTWSADRLGFVRRGFPWRSGGAEGLAFVAASSAPSHFEAALDAMLGHGGPPDALLRYASSLGGGIYYAKPLEAP